MLRFHASPVSIVGWWLSGSVNSACCELKGLIDKCERFLRLDDWNGTSEISMTCENLYLIMLKQSCRSQNECKSSVRKWN